MRRTESRENLFEFNVKEIRPARTMSEKCAAWALVYRRYLESGFTSRNTAAMYMSLLDLMPGNECWITLIEGQVVATMSTVFYSLAGLPSGQIYETDLKDYGIDGRHFCEFTKYAVCRSRAGDTTLPLEMVGALIADAYRRRVDDVVCVVHPDHARIWSQVYGFKYLGSAKSHPGVRDNPGVLMGIDISKLAPPFSDMSRKGVSIFRRILESQTDTERCYRLSGGEAAVLLLQRPELMTMSNSFQRQALEKHYPWSTSLIEGFLYESLDGGPRIFKTGEAPERDRGFSYATTLHPTQLSDARWFEPENPVALLIHDGQPYRSWLENSLEEEGFEAVTTSSLAQANRFVEEHTFDIILIPVAIETSQLAELVSLVRQRDQILGIHTVIIELASLMYNEPLRFPSTVNEELLSAEIICWRRLANILQKITKDGGVSEEKVSRRVA